MNPIQLIAKKRDAGELTAEEIAVLIDGHVQVVSSSGREPLAAGHSLVIPAACGPVVIESTSDAVLLETLPS